MWRLLALAALVGCPAPQAPAKPIPPPPPLMVVVPTPVAPIPPAPGDVAPKLRLPRLFVPASYAARLAIDPDKPTFAGHIEITGELSTTSSVIWLHGRHLAVKHATAVGSALPIELHVTPRGDDLLELTSEAALPPGSYKLALDYTGEIDNLNTTGAFVESMDKLKYVFSQFEAIYARRVFPCLDEPDSKVPWQLTLDVPKGQLAVSNTAVAHESEAGGHHVFEFETTKPLPAYLVAFGVGPFEFVPGGSTKSGVPVRIVTFKGHGGEAAYAAKTTAHVLDLLEAKFQIPYPYPKLDILTIPLTAGFGAMENAGLVTAAARYVLMEAKPSWERRATWIAGAAHELAHQWFGDLVTTAWWDDIWLNEGFANWMEHKITAEFDPAWHYEAAELATRDVALRADSLTHARRIRQPIAEAGDILNVFDRITYDKGASILNMFETYVGSDVFQRGVTQYLKDRSYGNATSSDFIAAISKASGRDLAPAFATFLDQPGEPEIAATLVCGTSPRVELVQRRYVPAGSATADATKPWIIPVCIAFEQDGKRVETCTMLDAPTGTLALTAKSCPRWIMPNVNGRGYYRVHYTTKQATSLRDEAWPLLSNTERRAVFGDVSASAATAPRPGFLDAKPEKLPLVLALSFVPKMLQGGDAFALEAVTGLPGRFDNLVADDQRAKQQAWYRVTFGPAVVKLGLVPKDSDDFEAEKARSELMGTAAVIARDPELVKQAQVLAEHWRDLPDASRTTVLRIAIDGDPERVGHAIAELRAVPKREDRTVLINTLAALRDPKSFAAALEVTLDPALDLRETERILSRSSTEATRAIAEAFFRAHAEALEKRLPKDEVAGTLYGIIHVFTNACDPKRRDELAGEVTKRFGSRPGGAQVVAEAIEQMDQCIATRAALEPEVRGWLGGVKIQKPTPPKAEKHVEKNKKAGGR
ncbi:MAG: M1 family aminopeptidase [Kofleriaceae bacterium]